MILEDFTRAVSQSFDSRFLLVLLKALALTIGLLIAFWFGMGWLLSGLSDWSFTLPLIGEVGVGFLAVRLAWLAVALASALLMFPVAAIFIGFFLDEVVSAVEARFYPHLPQIRPQPFAETLADAVQFFLLMLAVNLVALVFYLISGPLAPFVFWTVNGYLLAREYFQMVAARRLPPAEARALRKKNGGEVFLAGLLMAIPLTVPVLNLIIPILGVATFAHLFHRLSGTLPVRT
ncbi:MAG: EI24 domain-containing protein [Pseudomonadota bacterium]